MNKSKPGIAGIHDPAHLFKQSAASRRRRLVLPRYLDEEANKPFLQGAELDHAHQVLLRWAELDSSGHLNRKETSLDANFLNEVFADALRYALPTTSPDKYFLERSFTIPGVGTADGALGNFPPSTPASARVVIELKDANADLDYDKFNGRTPVQQCWDYLNSLPDCPWGIVSNFVSFRLYHRDNPPQAFEHFELQKLRNPEEFRRFYALFERNGLLPSPLTNTSRAEVLIKRSTTRQRMVGSRLFDYYAENCARLIDHLRQEHGKSSEHATEIAQTIFERVTFVAVCESFGFIRPGLLSRCACQIPFLTRAANPRWRNFLDLFEALRSGHVNLGNESGFDHALFCRMPDLDTLQLDDRWALILREFDAVDFQCEVPPELISAFFPAASEAAGVEFPPLPSAQPRDMSLPL